MYRINLRILVLLAVVATILGISSCSKDSTAPYIYFLKGQNGSDTVPVIDKKGDTTILLYTKYVDPGVLVEDNASNTVDIQVTDDISSVLPIEKKNAAHMDEVKKIGEYKITYSATDEAGNVGTKSKVITIRNLSDIYSGKYYTKRNSIPSSYGLSIGRDTSYTSNITPATGVMGRLRFSKVACHVYEGKAVSFKVDADLYSAERSPRSRSEQIGFMGTAEDKESPIYKGLSYEAAIDSLRYEYVYLQIPTQEYVAYTDAEAATDYKVRIQGRLQEDGKTPRSKIVYNEQGVMLEIVLELSITVGNQAVQNYIERYKPE